MQFQPIDVLVVSHKKGLKKTMSCAQPAAMPQELASLQVGVAAGTVLPEQDRLKSDHSSAFRGKWKKSGSSMSAITEIGKA